MSESDVELFEELIAKEENMNGNDDLSNSQISTARMVRFEDEENGHTKEEHKIFNDPIHGHIKLHPLLVKVIDTPQFQRLRFIKQLGANYFVYPGASHNRFEHCIGTCYLAGKLARLLQANQSELKITDKDILCVELAGLCHDLGHGPYSHMFDDMFMKKMNPTSGWKHEIGSCRMIDHMIASPSNHMMEDFNSYGLDETDILFVKEMIAGQLLYPNNSNNGTELKDKKDVWIYKGREEDKSFLFEIVSNEINKVDVDKWDYFARDCHHLGLNNSFDHNRFMEFIKVLKIKGSDRYQICARDKEVGNLYEMFHTRDTLHRRAYQHDVSNIIEHMICEALSLADEYYKFTGQNGRKYKISEACEDMEAFTKLTDNIYFDILHSEDPNLWKARNILQDIQRRRIYKIVGQSNQFTTDHSNNDARVRQEIANKDENGILKPDDLVILCVNLNYGMKDENPIDNFLFFSKHNSKIAYKIRRDDFSRMAPNVFQESIMKVYCKDKDKLLVAKRCFKLWCPNSSIVSAIDGLTPYKHKSNGDHNEAPKKKVPKKALLFENLRK